jgi:L-rhamnonate dehydratase
VFSGRNSARVSLRLHEVDTLPLVGNPFTQDAGYHVKITNVRACQPVTETSPDDWRTSIGQILVAVDTDCGVTGYGVGGGGFAGIHLVQTVLRDVLLGRNPDQIEELWSEVYDATLAFGQKGIVLMAMSGVDLALWDVRGRAEKQSVTELLGGAKQTRLPTYITVWDYEALAKVADRPHRGFKLHLGEQAPQDESIDEFADRIAGELREARRLIGPERELMADAWMKWSRPAAQAVIERIADVNLSWLEEPLPLDDEAGYEALVGLGTVPIAGGEHEYTSAAFRKLVDRRLHSVLQPDVNWVGGLTELIRIYELAAEHDDIRVCPHRGAEIWSLPALAALDPEPLAESGRPWMTWVNGQPPIVDGWIEIPDRPGFGLDIDEAALRICPTPPLAEQWLSR